MTASPSDSLVLPCGAVLPNRLMKSAMSEALGTVDNRVTDALPRLYERWARGGVGLLVTGNVMIDRRALGEHSCIALEDGRDLPMLRAWAEAGRSQGAQLWMQLNHPGKQVPRGLNRESVAPSAVPFAPQLAPYFATPRALTEAEIEDIIARFALSATLAREAGFDGVQMHAAHGYLLSQFLSPHHNQRDDAWGGSLENRTRIVREVYRRIRSAVGPGFAVSIKLNSADFQKGGFSEAESLETVSMLAGLGMDLIEISGGTYEAPAMAQGTPVKESTRKREAYFLEFAEQVRARTSVPLAVTGGFRTRQGIEAALASGALDVVGLARPLALDPDFARRVLDGEDVTSPVQPIRTGISLIDRTAMMEVGYYTRQLHRLGAGREPKPDANPTLAALAVLSSQSLGSLWSRVRA